MEPLPAFKFSKAGAPAPPRGSSLILLLDHYTAPAKTSARKPPASPQASRSVRDLISMATTLLPLTSITVFSFRCYPISNFPSDVPVQLSASLLLSLRSFRSPFPLTITSRGSTGGAGASVRVSAVNTPFSSFPRATPPPDWRIINVPNVSY
jgi:hypothetical protein